MKPKFPKRLYGAIGFGLTVFFYYSLLRTTFTFFLSFYWIYASIFTVVFGGIMLYYIHKNINEYGLLNFFVVIFLLPNLTFYQIPKTLHYLNLISVKKVVLEGVVENKYFTNKGDYYFHVDINILDNLPKSMKIQTVMKRKMYKRFKINDKIKFIGTLSSVGFDFIDVVK